jgi:hypothetical protein
MNCGHLFGQRLNQNNIVEVLEWSGQPYGSAWVNRQAYQYLLEVTDNSRTLTQTVGWYF